METFMYTLDDDIFDLDYYDSSVDYSDDLASTGSNESDIENSNPFTQCSYMKKTSTNRHTGSKILQRKAANMRERRRMKSINDAFDTLRKCIPVSESVERKLSKVDTLKLAMNYIGYLADLIKTTGEFSTDSKYSNCEKHEKVILRCQFTENDPETGDVQPLLGHSLTWSDDKAGSTPSPNHNHKLCAKVWYPHFANEADLLNIASYSNDFSKIS